MCRGACWWTKTHCARRLKSASLPARRCDVFGAEPPDARQWRDLDNVVLTPHVAGYTAEAGVALFGQLRENLRRYFAREPLLTPMEDPWS